MAKKMCAAYRMDRALVAQAELEELVHELKVPPRGRRFAPRRPGRDPNRHPPRRIAHPGRHPTINQPNRVHDLDVAGDHFANVKHSAPTAQMALRPGAPPGWPKPPKTIQEGKRFLAPTRSAPCGRRRGRHDNRHTTRGVRWPGSGLKATGRHQIPRNSGHPLAPAQQGGPGAVQRAVYQDGWHTSFRR